MKIIEHREVPSGGASSIVFTSIPQTYEDLYLVVNARTTDANLGTDLKLEFNGSSANFSYRHLYGDGSNPGSYGTSTNYQGWAVGANSTSNTFSSTAFYIQNYTSSTPKSISNDHVNENSATTAFHGIISSVWDNNSAISQIEIKIQTGSLVQYSSATLYGVSKYNTTSTPKATGGIISFDSANIKWVHIFTANGTFTPSENLTAEYLVVAGGGGSNTAYNTPRGGGGAGGYRSSVVGESSGGGASAESAVSLTASTGYTVTVGAGGAGAIVTGQGANGSDSTFSTITSTGGGRGGYNDGVAGAAGGSGGGGSYGGAGGAGTTDQGFAGGAGSTGSNQPSGGGGGAGATGTAGGSSTGGAGGAGIASSITGTSIYRAGGGGGSTYNGGTPGTGGLGGGGNGNRLSKGNDGEPATGGGGGGTGDYSTGSGGSGGSGVVIVRYDA